MLEPFIRRAREAESRGLIRFRFRHQVDELITINGRVVGARGSELRQDDCLRGQRSNREIVGDFEIAAGSVIVTAGGIGGNHDLVRRNWPVERLGPAPQSMVSGVPHHVDGRMLEIAGRARGSIINADRMWHYTEGLRNFDPIWPNHGIRILPGPSSFWCDADGNRFAAPAMPGFDTLGTLKAIRQGGNEYSWFILTKAIIKKEFALSGSEQNPDLTGKDIRLLLKRLGKNPPAPVQAFMDKGEDFVVRNRLEDLVAGDECDHRRGQAFGCGICASRSRRAIGRWTNGFSKDAQVTAIRGARHYLGDQAHAHGQAAPHSGSEGGTADRGAAAYPDPQDAGRAADRSCPGGCWSCQAEPVPGLYAAGEIAGFGGGGMHGYNALEGTFLGGCIFSGRIAGRSV